MACIAIQLGGDRGFNTSRVERPLRTTGFNGHETVARAGAGGLLVEGQTHTQSVETIPYVRHVASLGELVLPSS